VEGIRSALRGRERRDPVRGHPFAVDGQARRENEREQGVHTADKEETEKPDRHHRGARHQSVDGKEARGRRGVLAQEQVEERVRGEGGDPERRVVELAEDTDVVRHRAQTPSGGNEHRRGEGLGRRQESAGPRDHRRDRYRRGEDRDRQEYAGEKKGRGLVQEEENRSSGGHGPVAVRRIPADQVRARHCTAIIIISFGVSFVSRRSRTQYIGRHVVTRIIGIIQ